MEKRRIGTKTNIRAVDVMSITGKTCAEKANKEEYFGSVAAKQDNLKNSKEAGRESQGTQGLSITCRCIESVSFLSCMIKYFRVYDSHF